MPRSTLKCFGAKLLYGYPSYPKGFLERITGSNSQAGSSAPADFTTWQGGACRHKKGCRLRNSLWSGLRGSNLQAGISDSVAFTLGKAALADTKRLSLTQQPLERITRLELASRELCSCGLHNLASVWHAHKRVSPR